MSKAPADSLLDSETTFSDAPFSTLDPRILRALADLSFAHPTLVQAKAIPLLLQGKDVLAKARTGSGKTAAYCVPGLQKILSAKETLGPAAKDYQATRMVVLVPTKELSLQVTAFLKKLTTYCEGVVGVCNASSGGAGVQRVLLNELPDIIVSTPTRLLALLQAKTVMLDKLEFLAIDEADLLLSYGHKDDLTRMMDPASGFVPKVGVQGCLMSATLGEEMEGVKGLILRNPAILTLSEPTTADLLKQYYTLTTERDKFLLIYVLLKLKLVRGKSIIFVNEIDRGYRVKLFLEQFGVKACVVNSELPLASRYHVVEEFNRGVYEVVVATDEVVAEEDDLLEAKQEEEEEDGEEEDVAEEDVAEEDVAEEDVAEEDVAETKEAETEERDEGMAVEERQPEAGPSKRRRVASPHPPHPASNKRPKSAAKAQSSFARGIDFTSASSVINFDLPTTSSAYMHRIGRTARAGHSGLALSLVVPKNEWGKDKHTALKSAAKDEEVWKRVVQRLKNEGAGDPKEWDWGGRKSEVEAFRYRMEDALRAVTPVRVKEARREEIKRELLNSDKLKAHFAANPLDLAYLRHDQPLHPARQQPHLKHVPGYLMPKIAALPDGGGGADAADGSHIGFRGGRGGRGRGRGRGGGAGGRGGPGGARGGKAKKVDPLRFKGT